MFKIEANGKLIDAVPGETILSALKRADIHVPTLCYMENLPPSGACRICVVELEGAGGLVPSCSYPVREGMKLKTNSTRVIQARKTIVELLQANHPDDCLYCVRSGTCQLQDLSKTYLVRQKRYNREKAKHVFDVSGNSLIRDPAKCVLCGKCVRVCEEVQGVSCIDFVGRGSKTIVGTAFNEALNISSCINCGQCILVCPTGALRERSGLYGIIEALENPDKIVAVQHAPSVSVSMSEEFGLPPGTDLDGKMVAALRAIGVDYVFDTSFSADLTIMEEASELVHRLTTGGKLPMATSCCPGWVKFAEQTYPDLLENVSTCKSPQQMMASIIRTFFADKEGIDPKKLFNVSIMPCTAKKFEAARPEMTHNKIRDVDSVITTRELVRLIKHYGVDMQTIQPEAADAPFGQRSTAGKLFGGTGGVMEAAIRTAHYLVTGKELEELKVEAVRGLDDVKEAKVNIEGTEIGVAVVNGLGNVQKLMEQVRNGERKDLHFIEIMACPGGCIAGGGQPIGTTLESIKARLDTLYNIDDADAEKERLQALFQVAKIDSVRVSHKNEQIQALYEAYLEKPLGEKSHHYLHTHYYKRDVLK